VSVSPHDVIDFWFRDTPRERWFRVDPEFDKQIRDRFAEVWKRGREGLLKAWEDTPEDTLALVVLLDQFPRNMFRGTADAFASDGMARDVAKRAIAKNFDFAIPPEGRSFLYLPLMHSEVPADQDESVRLTEERLGKTHYSMPYALNHRDVIRRFGRFPARNKALGRETTPEEAEFLRANPSGY
jgi:uncharacterized protein (DUF924 family)